jgi:hypothetical protein
MIGGEMNETERLIKAIKRVRPSRRQESSTSVRIYLDWPNLLRDLSVAAGAEDHPDLAAVLERLSFAMEQGGDRMIEGYVAFTLEYLAQRKTIADIVAKEGQAEIENSK